MFKLAQWFDSDFPRPYGWTETTGLDGGLPAVSGLPDFSFFKYQNGRKYTKLPLNYQVSVNYTKLP
jgi:hypothetical protein